MKYEHPRQAINPHEKRNDEDRREGYTTQEEMSVSKARSVHETRIYYRSFNRRQGNNGNSKKNGPNLAGKMRR